MHQQGVEYSIYDELPIGVMALDRDRTVRIWNRCLHRWSGVEPAAVIGRQLSQAFPDFDDSRYAPRLNQLFESGAPIVLSVQFHGLVIPIDLPDGTARVQQATITPIPAPDGERWALFVIQDVTQLARQIQAFRGMRAQALEASRKAEAAKHLAECHAAQLQDVNRELEQFAHVASHDLQEPLRTILSFSSFLAEDLAEDLSPAARNDLDHICEAADRMRCLITDLLELSRVSQREIARQRFPLGDCVADSLLALDHRVRETAAVIEGAVDLPEVVGDPRMLTQLFQNLLGNAMKFTLPGSASHITLAANHAGKEWILDVRDNGIGIDEQFSHKILAPFQRLHDRATYPGSGIGLAICKRAVERHRGEIWVEPNPGAGSIFRFTLPAE